MHARMTYHYSTKNFHRYIDPSGIPTEIYIPRAFMPEPVMSVTVEVKVLDNQKVPLAAKPVKA